MSYTIRYYDEAIKEMEKGITKAESVDDLLKYAFTAIEKLTLVSYSEFSTEEERTDANAANFAVRWVSVVAARMTREKSFDRAKLLELFRKECE
ncbi:hypothetical protein [uncultured Eubacterium sp.]|uniref:hypothetical protein n=1 Tax=uncultured Eubacterium sp. TaxID=165185 RepID=UPI00259A8BE3|nr:hypothetical protein [uncultured Eubacterium sp.]